MLTDSERQRLREALEAERQRLLRAAQEGLSFAMNRERNIGRDSIDESMEEELFSTELRLRDREKFLLNKIVAAIERLANGTIDECEDCGEIIGFKRLLVRPMTTLCIDCKEEREQAEATAAQGNRGGGAAGSEGVTAGASEPTNDLGMSSPGSVEES